MKNVLLNDPQQLERRLLKIFERHGSDGRAITLDSLAANVGMQQQAKDLLLALGNLVTRGLVKRAGDNPIPGSSVAFRLVRAASPHDLSAATSAAADSGPPVKGLDQGSSSKPFTRELTAAQRH